MSGFLAETVKNPCKFHINSTIFNPKKRTQNAHNCFIIRNLLTINKSVATIIAGFNKLAYFGGNNMVDNSNGYYNKVVELISKIETEQYETLKAAGQLMAQAVKEDRLIHVYGGGGHTTLPVGEMFFRAGGLCNINPCMETGLSVFNQAQKYLALERCVNYGRSIMDYYDLQEGDILIIFHNIGVNAATIDAALQAKERNAKIIAISSSDWQEKIPEDDALRHPSKKNLFDIADICIEDYNPLGDTVVSLEGLETSIGPVSNMTDFYIAHRLEIECAKTCLEMGIEPPFWRSANVAGGDEFNQENLKKYSPRIKML